MSVTHSRLGAARPELAVDRCRWSYRGGVGAGGEHRPAALHTASARFFVSRPLCWRPVVSALAFPGLMQLEQPIHRVVLSVRLAQVGDQLLIADLPTRRWPGPARRDSPAR